MYNEQLNGGNLLSISEFAELAGTTADTLRFYDKEGLLNPAKYGDGTKSKYRYYTAAQIVPFKMIRVLTEIGVPLEAVKAYADGGKTPESLIKLLSKQKDILSNKLTFIEESHSLISAKLELLNIGLSATENEIYVADFPEAQIIMGDVCDYEGSYSFYGEFTRFCNGEHSPKLNPAYPIGGYWDIMDDFVYESTKPATLPARFFSLDPKGHQRITAGLYLVAHTRGYYAQTNDLPKRMKEYAKKNGLIFNGPVYNIYPLDEFSISDPNQYLLRAFASVKKTKRVPLQRTYSP